MSIQLSLSQFLFSLTLILLSACSKSQESNLELETKTETPEALPEVIRKPLNCPVMLVAYSGSNRFDEQNQLWFTLKQNPNFDANLEDDCKGDLKNIWPDLIRFKTEIKENFPRISQIISITSYLEYFPQTEEDLKAYINIASIDELLYDEVVQIDRSTLEGGMEFDMHVIQFIQTHENNYWMEQHAPIIERVLRDYDLKMDNYDSEKSFYCYHLFDVCRKTQPNAPQQTSNELSLEYMRPGFDWFSFQKTAVETVQ